MKKRTLAIVAVLLVAAVMTGIFAACVTEFQLKFMVDGEVYAVVNTAGEETVKLPENPTKEGYIFDGWYWDDGIWAQPFTAESLLEQKLESDMAVYAKWLEEDITKRTFKVTFDSMSGSAVEPVTALYGTLVKKPSDPTRTGYVFVGWYKQADLSEEWDFSSDTLTENITLYAKWVSESDASGCDILTAEGFDFDAEGKTLSIKTPNSQEYFALSSALTVSPYASWTVTSDAEGREEVPSATVPLQVGDNTFYINITSGTQSNKNQYTVNIRRRAIYTVTYDFAGGGESVSEQVEEDGLAPAKEGTRTGYTFSGWTAGETAWDFEESVVTGDITLTAVWTANTYSVTFDAAGGEETEGVEVTFGSAAQLPVPERSGYTFTGWQKEDGTAVSDAAGAVGEWNIAEDVSLTASWSVVTYDVTYNNVEGATHPNPATYTVEDAAVALQDAAKTGYTFLGWYSDAEFAQEVSEIDTSACEDVELWARWEVITYTATFVNSDGTVGTVDFDIEDTALSEPAVPQRTGYTGAWEDYEIKAEDLTINAVYTPITYDITYENTKGAANGNPATYNIETATITLSGITSPGYTFEGWFVGEEKVESIELGSYGDITLTAKWAVITYNITYIYDDTMGDLAEGAQLKSTYTIEEQFEFTPLVCHTTGYNFAGWFTQKDLGTGEQVTGVSLGSTGDITVYAQWGLEVYSIFYRGTEGAENSNPVTYTIESETFTIAPLARAGYNFLGWFEADGETPAQTTVSTGSYGDLEFYAKWQVVGYTITYNMYDGEWEGEASPAAYTIEESVTFTDLVREGYFFAGWYSLAEGGELTTGIALGSTGNVTVYARWINFDPKGGSEINYEMEYSSSGLTKPEDPSKDYYDFGGWFTDESFEDEFDFSLPERSLTLYAKWIPTEYAITYVLDGGTNNAANPATYNVEESVTFAAPSKVGHTFNGWYSTPEFTSAPLEGIEAGSYGAVTVYASFSINSYTISFDTNEGTSVADIEQYYGTDVTRPADPAKTGYSFGGWFSDRALRTPYVFTTMPAEDITVYAKWNVINYDIVYNLDGGTNNASNPASFNIESGSIVLREPSKRGYTFVGWFTDSAFEEQVGSIPAGSYGEKEFFACWEVIVYDITYNMPEGAENPNPLTYTVESALTNFEAASFAGYTFGGFFTSESYGEQVTSFGGGAIGDVTVFAKFTPNSYVVWLDGSEEASSVVTFDLNGASGEAPAAQTVTESATLSYPAAPERAGYLFGGWFANSACEGEAFDFSGLIGSDVTLYAKWVPLDEGAGEIKMNGSAEVNLLGTAEKAYRFIPLASGNVSITTSGSIDTLGSLYSGGTLLKQNDDGGSNGNFLITYNVTAGRVYEIRVRAFSSSTDGTATLSLSGSGEAADGGYTAAGNKTSVTFGAEFTLPVPEGENLQKFLGWQDASGVMYTDAAGNGLRAWDVASETTLFSKWERMEYEVSFVTSGGSPVESVTLEYGARLDVNSFVTTQEGKTFLGWFLNSSDEEPYNATTMPDHDITLTAKWTNYSLGSIKYDESKKAVSINDEITPELFSALCIDSNGLPVELSAAVNGTFAEGATVAVRLSGASGGKNAVATIQNVKIYGAPELSVENVDKDFINPDEFTAEAWGASGVDTFDGATEIVVEIEGEYAPGDVCTVVVKAIDPAGNVTREEIADVKVYGLPEISFDEELIGVSESDELTAALIGASAADSFGEQLTVNASLESGSWSAGENIVVRLTATDGKGNENHVDVDLRVYGTPEISSAQTLEFSVGDEITPESMGVSAFDTFEGELSVSLSTVSGEQTAGSIMTVRASVTDITGNAATQDFAVKIYGAPRVSYDRAGLKVGEDPTMPGSVVSFDLNYEGATGAPETQIVTDTVGLVYPEIPQREGYVFAGWYENSACSGEIYDFGADVTRGTKILYAKWLSYVGGGTIDYNGSLSVNVISQNSSARTQDYYAFVPLVSGSVRIYSANGMSDTYGYLYDSNKSLLESDDDDGDGNNFSITYALTAGTLYYIRPAGYNNGSGSTTVYISGAEPQEGGKGTTVTGAEAWLFAEAYDSFGQSLSVTATLETGELIAGGKVTFKLTATDHLGNSASIFTAPIGVYDEEDIELDLMSGASDTIKLTSKGEEFSASATDSFGEDCELSVTRADGSPLVAGETQSVIVTARDKAGNSVSSDVIAGVKVYDLPEISYLKDELYITAGETIDFMFLAYDSFGEEIYAEVTVNEETESIYAVTVTATDAAGNTATMECEVIKVPAGGSLVILTVDGVVVGRQAVSFGEEFSLPGASDEVIAAATENFAGWEYEGELITANDGAGLEAWNLESGVYTLTANATVRTYSVTYELDGGINNSANPSSYSIVTLGGADGVIPLEDPTKYTNDVFSVNADGTFTRYAYKFLGWYKDSGFEQKVSELSLALGSVTIYAKWADMLTEVSANYVRVNENNELDEDGEYILFGQYPQTIKAADVSIISTTPDTDGYYRGSDGERYAKVVADPYNSGYTFSNNSSVIDGITYYFKVEPIRWRILSESDGNAFILCDSIIANKAYDAGNNNNNNYANSDIRAWLNDEFYKTAFGALQQAIIQTTEVDNSVLSTGYASNPYACENTFDKVFLLSYHVVTHRNYGFANDPSAYDAARLMLTSDFSRATGAYMSTESSYYGNGWWWLRSPSGNGSNIARGVYSYGRAYGNDFVNYAYNGVVPALNLTLS